MSQMAALSPQGRLRVIQVQRIEGSSIGLRPHRRPIQLSPETLWAWPWMIRLPVVRMDGKSYCQVGLLRTPCDGKVPVPAYFMTGPVASSSTSRLPHGVVVFTDIV